MNLGCANPAINTGLVLQLFMLACLLLMGSGQSTFDFDGRLPSLNSLEALHGDSSSGEKAADTQAIVLLSTTCPACRMLVTRISRNYGMMRMKVTGIIAGTRKSAVAFIDDTEPVFEMLYSDSIHKWSGIRIRTFPFIIITDLQRNVVALGAEPTDLY